VSERPEILVELCRGYENSLSAMPCGTILREALRFESVAAVILYDESGEGEPATVVQNIQVEKIQSGDGLFWNFFQWIQHGSFEVGADAFTTFRVSTTVGLAPTRVCGEVNSGRAWV
jgi:calcium binding protein 39